MTEYALNQRRAVTPDKNCRGMVQNFQDLSLDSSFFLGECNWCKIYDLLVKTILTAAGK